jgi:cardiolipin synthase A/B
MHWAINYTLFYLTLEWAIRLAMLAVVTRGRRPVVAMAWLLIIFFEPIIGIILYGLFGRNRLPRRRIEQHEQLLQKFREFEERVKDDDAATIPQLGPECEAAVKLAQRLGYMPIVGGNAVEVLTEAQEVIDRIIDDIDAAEHHVHLLFYIYAADGTGERVSAAIRTGG